nr:hypothetical protein [Xanthomonas translucens]
MEASFFDVVVTPPGPYPRHSDCRGQPVADADYAIGCAQRAGDATAARQIGIGTLADALPCAGAAAYRQCALPAGAGGIDPALAAHPAVQECGGLALLSIGLFGCSEMLNEGFRQLVQCGVIKRKVLDDAELMQRVAASAPMPATRRGCSDGEYLQGAFYLGSPEFYAWLREMPPAQARAGIGTHRISAINQPYGDERLRCLQTWREARFFNSA